MGQSRSLFVYFRLFYMTQVNYKLIKVLMVCLGLEPGTARWKALTNPLSYGNTPLIGTYVLLLHKKIVTNLQELVTKLN